jgi:hypothetical protein
MGFSGGGSNILRAHTHDGTVVQDGGSLNFDNITQGALTAGDVIYSDGVHMQRLGIGGAGTVIESSGAVPQWSSVAPAAPVMSVDGQIIYYNSGRTALNPGSVGQVLEMSGGFPSWQDKAIPKYEFLTENSVTSGTTLAISFTGVSSPDYVIYVFDGTCTAGQGNNVRINTLSTNTYSQQGVEVDAGTITAVNVASQTRFYGVNSGISGGGDMCTGTVRNNILTDQIQYTSHVSTHNNGYASTSGFNTTAGQTSITDIEFLSGSSFSGTLSAWKVSN